MRVLLIPLLVYFTHACYANEQRPCEIVGFKTLSKYGVPLPDTNSAEGLTSQDISEDADMVRKCMSDYSVCIIGAPPKKWRWFSKKLESPAIDTEFGFIENRLVSGLIQYVDKEKNYSVCMTATNELSTVVPWYAVVWIIKGDTIVQYEMREDSFNSYISPKGLFNAFKKSLDITLKYSDPQKTYHISEAIKQ